MNLIDMRKTFVNQVVLLEAVGELKVVRLVKDSKADERKKAKQPQWLTRQMLYAAMIAITFLDFSGIEFNLFLIHPISLLD